MDAKQIGQADECAQAKAASKAKLAAAAAKGSKSVSPRRPCALLRGLAAACLAGPTL